MNRDLYQLTLCSSGRDNGLGMKSELKINDTGLQTAVSHPGSTIARCKSRSDDGVNKLTFRRFNAFKWRAAAVWG